MYMYMYVVGNVNILVVHISTTFLESHEYFIVWDRGATFRMFCMTDDAHHVLIVYDFYM